MALIKDEDIQLVRERVRIDEVVEQYVTLRKSGAGALVGLCPFHDEKSPSFNVRPSQGFYYCFGCGAGGDAIKFLREIEGLTFSESVERLAQKYGIELRYDESATGSGPRRDPGQRSRLLAAHKAAAEFYATQLGTAADAAPGRQFVADRGFDQAAAELFGMGWAPRGGEALVAHLRGQGFSEDELVIGGLAARGSRGLYDKFRGRVLWPIREISGDVIGFGARRMFDDDRVEAKYLNTAETPIYKKSHVLYGIDLARRSMSSKSQAVVVEGYTDVMACHLAGVTTAVATCGTAFGADHVRALRRVLLDHDAMRGEVIFTFDGDEAGRRAAMKTFSGDQQFVAQTYVAIAPGGMDPCDLRLAEGDAAVRELVASRIPLYRFVLDNMLSRFDLDRSDQRIDAVREAVTLTIAVRDRAKVDEFLREIANRVGVDLDVVRREHQSFTKTKPGTTKKKALPPRSDATAAEAPVAVTPSSPPIGAPQFADEREALKAIVQYPHVAASGIEHLGAEDFTHPIARELFTQLVAGGLPTQVDPSWLPRMSDSLESPDLVSLLGVAAMDPISASESSVFSVVVSRLARLREVTVARRIADLKSRLQRTNPVEKPDEYNAMFTELVGLEQQRRELRQQVIAAIS